MDPEHYGANLFYARRPLDGNVLERFQARRPNRDAAALVPIGWDALRERIDEWTAQGFSKFLLRPIEPPTDWSNELEELASEILPLTS